MKLMSFHLTTEAMINSRNKILNNMYYDKDKPTKDVTRRNGWARAKAGDIVLAVEKGRGVRVINRKVLGEIIFVYVNQEKLFDLENYRPNEVAREGFPRMTAKEFMRMYCKANMCSVEQMVTRIEFIWKDQIPDGYQIVNPELGANVSTTRSGDLVWCRDKKTFIPVDSVNEYVSEYHLVIRRA